MRLEKQFFLNPHASCLALVWPPGAKPMAAEALDAFEQRRNGLSRVVYWGEGGGGCHADDDFHKALEDNWTLEKRVSCDQRWCLSDILWFYRTPDNPILDRKRKTDWLTDIQVANIQGLLWESQKAGTWDRNPGLSVYFQYPSTLALVIGDLSKHTGNYLRVTADNSVLFTIINRGGNHWVLLVLDNITTKRALYFDSLGQDIPETLCTALSTQFADFIQMNLCPQIQFEGFQCGVWACWLISTLLDRLLKGKVLHTLLFDELIAVDGCSNQDSQDSNCAFITELRESFTVLLEEAKHNDELPWE